AGRGGGGFVEGVVARAQPEPWPARLLRGLFVPWATKLPLEAVAIVLVGGLAVWVFQRTPEQQRAAQGVAEPPRAEAPGRVVQGYLPPPESPPAPTAPTPTAPTPTAPTPAAPMPAAPTPAPATVPAEKARIEQKETQDAQPPADVRARRSEVQRAVPESREEPSPE